MHVSAVKEFSLRRLNETTMIAWSCVMNATNSTTSSPTDHKDKEMDEKKVRYSWKGNYDLWLPEDKTLDREGW